MSRSWSRRGDKSLWRHTSSQNRRLARDNVRRDLFTNVDKEVVGNGLTSLDSGNHISKASKPNSTFKPVNNTTKLQSAWNNADNEDSFGVSFAAVCVILGAVLVLLVTFVIPDADHADTEVNQTVKFKKEDGEIYLDWQSGRKVSIYGFLWGVLLSMLAGISCCGFSWTVTYYDSLEPGRCPPTPMSPAKYRNASGHNFHSSYIMSVVNGAAMSVYAIWWLSDKLWLV